jgi:recombination protein RecA
MGKREDGEAILLELQEKINKEMGEQVLIRGSQARSIPRTSTGILAYDLAMGGGLPLNQWVEIVGEESSGKTAIAFKMIAENMKRDPEYLCMWIAAEEFVRDYAESIGVDMDRLWVVESNEMEKVLTLVEKAVAQRAVDAVVIDSLPALVTETEVKKEAGDSSVATGAQILSRFFKKCARAQRRSLLEGTEDRDVLLIAINQWRDKIGVMFGDPRTTPGGKAKNYYYFIRMEVRRDDWLAEGSANDKRVGQAIITRIFKNKTYRPQQYASVDFYFADTKDGGHFKGEFDVAKDVINTALAIDGIFEGRYKFNGERIGKSKDDLYEAVREDIGLRNEIYQAVMDKALPHLKESGAEGDDTGEPSEVPGPGDAQDGEA